MYSYCLCSFSVERRVSSQEVVSSWWDMRKKHAKEEQNITCVVSRNTEGLIQRILGLFFPLLFLLLNDFRRIEGDLFPPMQDMLSDRTVD